MSILPSQCRAARALIEMDRTELALRAVVPTVHSGARKAWPNHPVPKSSPQFSIKVRRWLSIDHDLNRLRKL
jgi:hypothetical protein